MPTVCYQCKHFKNLETDSPRADVWYNHVCTAVTRDKMTNPVTGREQYVENNDLGRTVYTDQPYAYCRDVNTNGRCRWFVPQEAHG